MLIFAEKYRILLHRIFQLRSAPRRGGDDKRQRNRIRDMRKALSEKGGWKSMGRAVTE